MPVKKGKSQAANPGDIYRAAAAIRPASAKAARDVGRRMDEAAASRQTKRGQKRKKP